MRITFGLHVGSWHGPGAAHLGNPVVGQSAFLNLLEVQLGLSAPAVPAARRTAAYLVALRKADDPSRFYHGSLAADEIGTAAHLLRWRDEWMLGGWDGFGSQAWPQRLADLAAVENFVVGTVPQGEGERLAKVAEKLKVRSTQIESIRLLDPFALYPARWRTVLELLPLDRQPSEVATPVGDLGRLQTGCRQALEQRNLPVVNSLAHDATIHVLRPLSCEVAEHWLAHRIRCTPDASRMIVSEEHGASLDETLRAHGAPACGFGEASTLRPAMQALPLALETLWDPAEPNRLLEFLMHPVGPFSRKDRRTLGKAYAQQPGIGGPQWLAARERIRAESGDKALLAVDAWLESTRFSRTEGASLELVIARVSQLQQAIQGRASALDESATEQGELLAAVKQCSAVLQGLQELRGSDLTLVRPRLLEQLTAQATSGTSSSLAIAEVKCAQSASTPAACSVESADEVIWWMPAKPALPPSHPWVASELESLKAGGVQLRDPAAEMAALMAEWVRPVLAARKHLILMLPPEGTEEHPAWQLMKNIAPSIQTIPLDQFAANHGVLEVVPARPLRPPAGVWMLDPTAPWRAHFPRPTRMSTQSYSSLEIQLNNPALAILKDAAALRASNTVKVDDGTRLLGTLAHRLVERLFGEEGALGWNTARLDAWFPNALELLLEQEGAPLLAPGSAVQLHQFRQTARHGIEVLLVHLQHAGAFRVEAERALSGSMGDVPLNGATDLLVHLSGGRTAALDLKWSRASRFYDVLKQGEYLQLAFYAGMVEHELGQAPIAVGYFTFLDATLLTLTPELFAPSAKVVTAKNGATPVQLVQMASASWQWRVRQWQEGRIEVIGSGLDPEPTVPPDGCLPLKQLGPWYGDFEALYRSWDTAQ
ncbi:PD-(D/E)XK nuclease family protein [Polaromonas sp.]|uniref:PD-(D/E)XK nuclease family protein n=1 Tax=Polaromonas sp. TaxID=1869339 RepID=UPI00273133CA|nr:PD-(D/E)XK nuclease family protein [Polaromonas sp.]MDP1740965.1 hypothetical protein [Polaromonas sp.]